MSLIKNLVVEPENKPSRNRKGKNSEEDVSEEDNKPRPIVKSATDLQRLRLEKLMKNPDKPIVIPEPPSEKDYMQTVPTFVRNVMGSSAGAGSGEFHVYRHLRRKEYARQKTIQAKSMREQLDDEYQEKLNENKRIAEEKTAKKRAKRLKKKQRAKKPREQKQQSSNGAEDGEKNDETSDEDDEEEVDRIEKPNVVEELRDEEVTPQNDHEKKITEELEVGEKSNEDVVSEVAGPNIPEKPLEQKNDDSKEKTNKEEAEKIANSNEATTLENSPKTTAAEEENDVVEEND